MRQEKIKIIQKEYHRNGVSGRPFHLVRFESDDSKNMIAIVPVSPEKGCDCECYVFDLDKAASGNITFGSNSWRGDVFLDSILAQDKEF